MSLNDDPLDTYIFDGRPLRQYVKEAATKEIDYYKNLVIEKEAKITELEELLIKTDDEGKKLKSKVSMIEKSNKKLKNEIQKLKDKLKG